MAFELLAIGNGLWALRCGRWALGRGYRCTPISGQFQNSRRTWPKWSKEHPPPPFWGPGFPESAGNISPNQWISDSGDKKRPFAAGVCVVVMNTSVQLCSIYVNRQVS